MTCIALVEDRAAVKTAIRANGVRFTLRGARSEPASLWGRGGSGVNFLGKVTPKKLRRIRARFDSPACEASFSCQSLLLGWNGERNVSLMLAARADSRGGEEKRGQSALFKSTVTPLFLRADPDRAAGRLGARHRRRQPRSGWPQPLPGGRRIGARSRSSAGKTQSLTAAT